LIFINYKKQTNFKTTLSQKHGDNLSGVKYRAFKLDEKIKLNTTKVNGGEIVFFSKTTRSQQVRALKLSEKIQPGLGDTWSVSTLSI